MGNDESTDENPPQRTAMQRLVHTIGEVALSFPFAGGVFLMSIKLMCLNNHYCNDFGGVAFFVASFIVATIAWGIFLSLCKRLRDRPAARFKLDVSVIVITVVLWIAYFVTM
ncbi:MAG: hypothetical protein WBN06_06365 [Lysobacterales bacterium]